MASELMAKIAGEPWSNSRFGAYRQCPKKFFLQYVMDAPKLPPTIEAYVGTQVHELLYSIYKSKHLDTHGADWDLSTWLEHFQMLFDNKIPNGIRILGKHKKIETYRSAATRMIVDYWNMYEPFDDGELVFVEEKLTMETKGGNIFLGILDRVAIVDSMWVIVDYKTGKTIPPQTRFEADTQPVLYMLLLHKNYPDISVENIVCQWRYLRGMHTLTRWTTPGELAGMEEQIDDMVEHITSLCGAEDFPIREDYLCWWCDVRHHCVVGQNQKVFK